VRCSRFQPQPCHLRPHPKKRRLSVFGSLDKTKPHGVGVYLRPCQQHRWGNSGVRQQHSRAGRACPRRRARSEGLHQLGRQWVRKRRRLSGEVLGECGSKNASLPREGGLHNWIQLPGEGVRRPFHLQSKVNESTRLQHCRLLSPPANGRRRKLGSAGTLAKMSPQKAAFNQLLSLTQPRRHRSPHQR